MNEKVHTLSTVRALAVVGVILVIISLVCFLFFNTSSFFEDVLRAIGCVCIPAFTALGWKYLLNESEDQLQLLSRWGVSATLFYLIVGLLRVDPSRLGFSGVALTIISCAIVLVYYQRLPLRRYGGLILVPLLIGYIVLCYWLLLNNLETGIRWESDGLMPLQILLNDLALCGTFTVIVPQIFLLDIIEKM